MGTNVTDDGLKVVGTLEDLVLLRIGGTGITNQGVGQLKRLGRPRIMLE